MVTKAIDAYGVLFEIPDIEGLSVRSPFDGDSWTSQSFAVRSVTGILHRGLDYVRPVHTGIHPVLPGEVVYVFTDGRDMPGLQWDGSPGGYGNQITCRHDVAGVGTFYSHYGHIEEGGVLVKVGDVVDPDVVMAWSGVTGIADGAHLHWELRRADLHTRFDPAPYVNREIDQVAQRFTEDQLARLEALADYRTGGGVFLANALASLVFFGPGEGRDRILALADGRVPEHLHNGYASTIHDHALPAHSHPVPDDVIAAIAKLAQLEEDTDLWRAVERSIKSLGTEQGLKAATAMIVRFIRDNAVAPANLDEAGKWIARQLYLEGTAPRPPQPAEQLTAGGTAGEGKDR